MRVYAVKLSEFPAESGTVGFVGTLGHTYTVSIPADPGDGSRAQLVTSGTTDVDVQGFTCSHQVSVVENVIVVLIDDPSRSMTVEIPSGVQSDAVLYIGKVGSDITPFKLNGFNRGPDDAPAITMLI
jgi:hypothetical protein